MRAASDGRREDKRAEEGRMVEVIVMLRLQQRTISRKYAA